MKSNSKYNELATRKNNLSQEIKTLEQEMVKVRNTELAAIPMKYGYARLNLFIRDLKAASGQVRMSSTGKRFRAVITEETRTKLKQLVKKGMKGRQISKQLNISMPSIYNIKKSLGLVKARKTAKVQAGNV